MPKIYAAFAISLHRRYGFGFVRIGRVLADTQTYWLDAMEGAGGEDILRQCIEETGVDVMSAITAKELGEEGDLVI